MYSVWYLSVSNYTTCNRVKNQNTCNLYTVLQQIKILRFQTKIQLPGTNTLLPPSSSNIDLCKMFDFFIQYFFKTFLIVCIFERKWLTSSVCLPIKEERGLVLSLKNSERARSKHSYHDRTIFMLVVKIQAVIKCFFIHNKSISFLHIFYVLRFKRFVTVKK